MFIEVKHASCLNILFVQVIELRGQYSNISFPLPLSWFSLPISTIAHIVTSQQMRNDEPMLGYCWTSITKLVPALLYNWVNVAC